MTNIPHQPAALRDQCFTTIIRDWSDDKLVDIKKQINAVLNERRVVQTFAVYTKKTEAMYRSRPEEFLFLYQRLKRHIIAHTIRDLCPQLSIEQYNVFLTCLCDALSSDERDRFTKLRPSFSLDGVLTVEECNHIARVAKTTLNQRSSHIKPDSPALISALREMKWEGVEQEDFCLQQLNIPPGKTYMILEPDDSRINAVLTLRDDQ